MRLPIGLVENGAAQQAVAGLSLIRARTRSSKYPEK